MQKKDKNLFNVVSLRKLESILGIKRGLLRDVDKNADSYYRPFLNRKGGKLRKIDNPIGDLKFIQDRIYSRILKPINLPSTMLGGIPGNSIKDMAKLHVKKKNVISLDLKDCFPRTKDKRVYALFKKIGYSHKLAALLTRLTTYNTHIPPGSFN